MAEIKGIDRIAAKWARVAPSRTTDYVDGINAPRRDWARSAAAAQDTHTAAMQKAASNKSYSRGVTAAGTPRWQARSAAKGPDRYSQGVAIAEPDFNKGFAPYADVIGRTVLPPRMPKGDPRNLDRVRAIAAALHTKKTGSPTV